MAQTNESQEQVTVNVETLQPVTRTLMTIGALPTSYLISMTYEEQLLWLQNYLIKTVIPTINNNAEATQEVQDIVMALQDYINTQFSELNLQEYIDNKLDEMLESGVFENILMDYVQLTKVYDTYTEMIFESNTFTNGMKLKTMGYHFINDGGGAEYIVTNVQSETHYQVSIGLNKYIELIEDTQVNVKQFGAYGDGTNDDTTAIQNALNYSHNIYIPDGTYMVNAVTSLVPRSDTKIELSNGAILKAIPNDSTTYRIFLLDNVENIKLVGGTLEGEREYHTGATGEFGHCITIRNNTKDITISNMTLKKAWGDGISIVGENIELSNIIIDNVRRNGLSIINAKNLYIHDVQIKDVVGTAPQSAIDFEPNENTQELTNIRLENISSSNCSYGLFFSPHRLDDTSNPVDIIIDNFRDDGSNEGLHFTKSATVVGKIIINNPILINNITNGIVFSNWQNNDNFITTINRLYISRSITSGDHHQSAIFCQGIYGNGNVIFNNSYIKQDSSLTGLYDYYIQYTNNFKIINPLFKTFGITATSATNLLFKDENELYSVTSTTASGTIGTYELRSLSIKNATATTATTVNIGASCATGYECNFVNDNQTANYNIQLPADTYCKALSASSAPLIAIAPNSSIKLKRIDSENFRVVNMIGTITSN